MTDWKDEKTGGIVRVGHGENEKKPSNSSLSDLVIKPCPFCGNEPEMWNCAKDNVPNHVCCIKCGADGPRQENKQEAIEAWNERAL